MYSIEFKVNPGLVSDPVFELSIVVSGSEF
jgi:hypothetical protein